MIKLKCTNLGMNVWAELRADGKGRILDGQQRECWQINVYDECKVHSTPHYRLKDNGYRL